MLVFATRGSDPDAHKDLFARVHESFVLATPQ